MAKNNKAFFTKEEADFKRVVKQGVLAAMGEYDLTYYQVIGCLQQISNDLNMTFLSVVNQANEELKNNENKNT